MFDDQKIHSLKLKFCNIWWLECHENLNKFCMYRIILQQPNKLFNLTQGGQFVWLFQHAWSLCADVDDNDRLNIFLIVSSLMSCLLNFTSDLLVSCDYKPM